MYFLWLTITTLPKTTKKSLWNYTRHLFIIGNFTQSWNFTQALLVMLVTNITSVPPVMICEHNGVDETYHMVTGDAINSIRLSYYYKQRHTQNCCSYKWNKNILEFDCFVQGDQWQGDSGKALQGQTEVCRKAWKIFVAQKKTEKWTRLKDYL